MGTLNPRARGGSSLSETMKARRLREEQLGRQRVAIPQQKPPVGGSMQGFTRATPDRAVWDGSDARGWTFDTSADASPGDKPSLVTNDGLYFGPTEPGWYSTHTVIQFTLGSGSPAGVLVQANNNSSNVTTNGEAWAMNLLDGRYRAALWCGPFWCDGSSTPLGITVRVPGAFTVGTLSAATLVDVWRVG